MDLRCEAGKKFGELFPDDEIIEVKCDRPACGAGPGIIVLHGFDVQTGKLLGTERFAEPPRIGGARNGAQHNSAAVRSA
jgi:hypothetical protein